MVKPAERRSAAGHIVETYGVSERRACMLVALQRSTCRYAAHRPDDAPLRLRLRELAAEKPRYGYPRLWVLVRRDGVVVNRKKVHRLYREEGLQVRRRKRRRLERLPRGVKPQPTAANQRWSMDFVGDQLNDGRRFKVFNVVDDFTRECLACEAEPSITSERVVRILEGIAARRGYPNAMVMDNGPEFTGRKLEIWAWQHGVQLDFIQPGKPVQNAYIESFNGKLRD